MCTSSNCTETFEHGCDVLAVAFRPDGLEVCTAAVNGQIYVWDIESVLRKPLLKAREILAAAKRVEACGEAKRKMTPNVSQL